MASVPPSVSASGSSAVYTVLIAELRLGSYQRIDPSTGALVEVTSPDERATVERSFWWYMGSDPIFSFVQPCRVGCNEELPLRQLKAWDSRKRTIDLILNSGASYRFGYWTHFTLCEGPCDCPPHPSAVGEPDPALAPVGEPGPTVGPERPGPPDPWPHLPPIPPGRPTKEEIDNIAREIARRLGKDPGPWEPPVRDWPFHPRPLPPPDPSGSDGAVMEPFTDEDAERAREEKEREEWEKLLRELFGDDDREDEP